MARLDVRRLQEECNIWMANMVAQPVQALTPSPSTPGASSTTTQPQAKLKRQPCWFGVAARFGDGQAPNAKPPPLHLHLSLDPGLAADERGPARQRQRRRSRCPKKPTLTPWPTTSHRLGPGRAGRTGQAPAKGLNGRIKCHRQHHVPLRL